MNYDSSIGISTSLILKKRIGIVNNLASIQGEPEVDIESEYNSRSTSLVLIKFPTIERGLDCYHNVKGKLFLSI